MPVSAWIKAARLRTLPLAVAGAITGNLMALSETGSINQTVFLLSVLTAVLLQILSNYANDYGDFINGADTSIRTDRMMASGNISVKGMKKALTILIVITFFTGFLLLIKSIGFLNLKFLSMLILGIGGILAAYFYTAGKKPYGYIGLGDISVFIFFGMVAVVGTYYLQTNTVISNIWWVSAAIGSLSVGVLNVNNIRDIESDQLKNKKTIPVFLGLRNSLYYHALLIVTSFVCFSYYVYADFSHPIQLMFLILSPLFIKHFFDLIKAGKNGRQAYNQQLKNLSFLTLILSLVFCFSQLIIN